MSGREGLPSGIEALIREVLEGSRLDLGDRAEVESELRAHFEDGLEAGVAPDELVGRFGDPEKAGARIGQEIRNRKASARDLGGRGGMGLAGLGREVKQAARRLTRAPGFSLIVILTLALGVGANTAIFTVLHSVLLQPLPYRSPERLVRVYETPPDDPGNLNYLRGLTAAEYRHWDGVFESFAALYTYREVGADLTDVGTPVRISVVPVTAGCFETLGVAPALGRTFREEESVGPGEPSYTGGARDPIVPVLILSDHLWRDQFSADPGIVGRAVHLDDMAYEVVGVMPPGFDDPMGVSPDAWTPQDLREGGWNNWGNFYLSGVGRLREGLTLEVAQERATALYARLAETNPDAGEWSPRLVPLHEDIVGSSRAVMLWILAGAAGLVLLTACLNVANLVFARSLSQDREVALRSALGSERSRILAGLLAENGILALGGGLAGVFLGWGGVRALTAVGPDVLPRLARPEVGIGVFLFALAITAAALLAFGIAPALRMSRTSPAGILGSGGRSATVSRGVRRIRDGLVVAQVAVAVVLVAGAVLLTRSFSALLHVPLAIDPEGVLTFEVHLPVTRYPDGAAREDFHERFEAAVASLPGVEEVGAVSWLPMNGRYHIWGFYWDPEHPDGSNQEAWYDSEMRIFAGDYFRAVGIQMLRGVGPGEVDLKAEPMAWVSESATATFGDVDPVGQVVYAAGAERRIMGVVEDVPVDSRGITTWHTYVPHVQYADDRNWDLIQVAKARSDLLAVRSRIQEELRRLDPELVLHRPRPLTDLFRASRAQDRSTTLLMGAFALLALTLSLVGTYGILAGSVMARRREIGIRIALGADSGRVRGMVLRYAAVLTGSGLLLGMVGSLAGNRVMDTLLFGVESRDPVAYGVSVLVFLGTGLLAGCLPARRATRVNTVEVLKAE